MKNRLPLLFLSALFLGVYISPSLASAQLLPFGGLVSVATPCTCPGFIGNLWIYFTPFWFGKSSIPASGSVVYVPYVSQLYSWYEIGVPTTWHLGSYVPGVQACFMVVPPPGTGCVPLVSAGVIFQVGTSKSF